MRSRAGQRMVESQCRAAWRRPLRLSGCLGAQKATFLLPVANRGSAAQNDTHIAALADSDGLRS